jgi:Domain of unknown function (DUF4911)
VAVASLLSGPGLVLRRLRVADDDVVFLRSVIEGYDGLAALHGDGSGVVSLCAPESRAAELDELIRDLASELALLRL